MLNKSKSNTSSVLDRYLTKLSVQVEPFAVCMLDSGWRLTLPGPPCAMLHFVVQGNGWLSCPDGTHMSIGPNWVIVVPNGVGHSLETKEEFDQELKIDCIPTGPPVHYILAGDEGPVEMLVGCGTLNVRYGEAMGLFDHLNELLVVDLSTIPEVPGLFASLLRDQSSDAPGQPVLQGAIMTQLLVHLLRAVADQSDSELAWLSALDDPRLARSIDFIMENPAFHHTVESLSDVACMSRSAFSNHFHDAFKRTPMNLVNHVRLEKAARLLSSSHLPVEVIAQRVGFSSRSHFSQAFKRHMGHSPAEYRGTPA